MGKWYQNIRKQLSACYEQGEAQAMAFMLLEELCGMTKADVLMGKDDETDEKHASELLNAVKRLMEGEPIQYVIGQTQFCGLTIKVKSGVLIPRPETEELVEIVSKGCPTSILDIGTGSGCIALALKHRFPQADVTAIDVSTDALKIAQENAVRLGLDINFIHQDILQTTPDARQYDLIVSNPPYVCEREREEMEPHVLNYEPSIALFVPDECPLLFYKAITTYAAKALKEGGMLAFEANRSYAKEVGALMTTAGFCNVDVRKDLFNNERIVIGCLRKEA